MNNSFLALDVETANADYSSICQIGIAEVIDGQVKNEWCTLINPEAYFDPFNVSIHGINESDVKNAPTFDKIHSELIERISGRITVHHMPFDKIAISRACAEYNLKNINAKWLDSAKIVRRTWEQFAYRGYGLANIADFLKIQFEHHDALEDAKTAAKVVSYACEQTQISVEEWYEKVSQPIHISFGGSPDIKLEGNPEGPLYGEILVFTGALSLPRREAANIAASLGCNVEDSVTKTATILVVGTQDASKLAGYDKSSKHRKAEGLIAEGKEIKILSEKDFIEMCNDEGNNLNLQVPLSITNESGAKNTHKSQPKEPSLSIKIDLSNVFIEKASEALNKLSPNEQENFINQVGKASKYLKEHREFIDSIKDCSHDTKRALGNEFQLKLEAIKNLYDNLGIESYEYASLDILYTIESEIDQLADLTFDLMKNKITFSEFYESVEDSIDSIECDLESGEIPDKVKEYTMFIIKELLETKEEMMNLINK